jgi:hypothetical protein
MNFKTTYVLFGALLLLLVVAAVSLMTGTKPGEEGRVLDSAAAADVTAKDVTSVTLDRRAPTEQRLVFTRVGARKWKLTEPYEARVDGEQVERIVDEVLSLRKEEKPGDLSSNLANHGLDKPSLVVTLTRGAKDGTAERSWAVNFGQVTFGPPTSSLVFVTSSDAPREPAAVKRSSLNDLLRADVKEFNNAGDLVKDVRDFRSRDLLGEGSFNLPDTAKSVALTEGKNEVVLKRQDNGTWAFAKPATFGEADLEGDTAAGGTDVTGVKPLLNSLTNLRATSAGDIVENVTDFAQYGLEPGKLAGPKVELVRKDPNGEGTITETLDVGKKEEKGDNVYARLEGERAVVKVPASAIDPIRKVVERPNSLRDHNLLSFAAQTADGIDVKLPGEDKPIELRKVGEPPQWKLYDSAGQAQTANTPAVTTLLTDLGARRLVKDFPEPGATDAALGFDKPSAEITIWVGGVQPEEKKEEKKDEAKDKGKDAGKEAPKPEAKPAATPSKPKMKEPTARLILGKRDKDLLYVRRIVGTTKTDVAVPETLLAKVTKGRLDFVDSVLPSFVSADATKVTFPRGGETFAIEKQKKDDKSPEVWRIAQPPSRNDRNADPAKVQQILGDLSGLTALKLWAEKASDRELERYGLKPPKVQATVTTGKDKEAKEHVYQFGVETDDKTGYYAKQGDRDLVFIVKKAVLEPLESAELQDLTVFSLDPSKVIGLKLTGWKDVVGQPQTLEFEKKGATWSAKAPAGFIVNQAQLQSFLAALTQVRAEKFAVHKTGPKDEHKLTVAAGALEIVLTLDGEKDPVTLTVGGLDPSAASYFAQSNKLPGDVFTLPKDRFEKVKAKPGFFAAE